MKIENVIGDYVQFLDKIFDNLNKVGVNINELKELDHIAYRTESVSQYNQTKKDQ